MPTVFWFSILALAYVVAMATYHGVFLARRFILPPPNARARRDATTVLSELLLAMLILAPLLRRVVPFLTWAHEPSAVPAMAFYLATFAWLPVLKGAAVCVVPAGARQDATLGFLYSVPMSALYLVGMAYVLCVTIAMMVLR